MPIQSQDLDPAIALALSEWMAQLISQPAMPVERGAARLRGAGMSKWREAIRRNSYHFWAAGASFLGSIGSIPLLAPHGPGLTVLALLGLQALAVGLLVRGFQKSKRESTQQVSADLMRNAGELIELIPAEITYCAGVAALIEAGPALSEPARGEILRQLNELLSSYRKLDGPIRQYLAAGGNQPIEKLEQELAELVRRRDLQSDATARATMDQSAQLCAQRLMDARGLAPAREQAQAQQELILQALASVHASLSRLAVADSVGAQVGVEELQRTISQVNRQTRAVEEAVNEVVSLRG
jgi:hypothetical protein